MAITLTNFFSDLTEIRDFSDAVNGFYSSLASAKNAVVSRFDSAGTEELIADSEGIAADLYTAFATACTDIQTLAQDRLLHYAQIEDQSRYAGTSSMTDAQRLERVLFALHARLLSESKTVKSNVVTVGSVSATTTKTNAGTMNTCSYLSGVVAPTPNAPVNYEYHNDLTELSKTDSCNVECTTDVQSGTGITRGFETFRVSGKIAEPAPFAARYGTDGAGGDEIVYTQPIQGLSIYDLSFDTYTTANTPDDWTISSGTPGSTIYEGTTYVVGSGSSIRLTGTNDLRYPIAAADVRGRSMMYLVFLLRKDGATSGTYEISVSGTGFTTATTGALNASSLTTTFVPKFIKVAVPANIPSDFRINIVTTSISGGNGIYIDCGGFAEIAYWNGVGIAISEGEDSFTVGDRFTFTTSNNYAGDAQTSFAKYFRAQMPSTDPGSDYA